MLVVCVGLRCGSLVCPTSDNFPSQASGNRKTKNCLLSAAVACEMLSWSCSIFLLGSDEKYLLTLLETKQ